MMDTHKTTYVAQVAMLSTDVMLAGIESAAEAGEMFTLHDSDFMLDCALTYNLADPFAVKLEFRHGERKGPEWDISMDVLRDSLLGAPPVPGADFEMVCEGDIMMAMMSGEDDKTAVMAFKLSQVKSFVEIVDDMTSRSPRDFATEAVDDMFAKMEELLAGEAQ